jgi:hypothetical protein
MLTIHNINEIFFCFDMNLELQEGDSMGLPFFIVLSELDYQNLFVLTT